MKATINRDTCIGCGLCVDMCPEVFALDDKSIAIVNASSVPSESEEMCRDAAGSCPVEAIGIEA